MTLIIIKKQLIFKTQKDKLKNKYIIDLLLIYY